MASMDIGIKIQDHGTAVDEKKQRIRCKHCEKVVSGFSRLKCHLGWVRGDVVPCPEVPADVKEAFSKELHEKKKNNLSKDVGELSPPNLPTRRNWSNVSNAAEPLVPGCIQTSQNGSEKRLRTGTSSGNSGTNSMNPYSQSVTSNQNLSSRDIQKCIGKFFFETGLDFDAANLPSFRRMMYANHSNLNTVYRIPSSEDLKGWILQEVWDEMQEYVNNIRASWASTGCSILLDGWLDSKGRNLLNILAACPKGTVYIRSANISGFDGDFNPMLLILDEVLNEVGVENVVQIITYTTSAWMEELGKRLVNKYKNLFWTVSDSHCIKLMLEKIGRTKHFQEILVKAKTISRFVHSHAFILKLMRDQTSVQDLVKPSKFDFVVPFLTLENMVSERKNIEDMFLSPVWKNSSLALTPEGRRVAELVADCSFWTGAIVVLQATIPLVRVLELISKNVPKIAYIYETMDQAKETIKRGFKEKKSSYMPFWIVIDDIWNKHLHSPLHAAGYFLNPELFYTSDFYSDAEVCNGLVACISTMGKSQDSQSITLQLDKYSKGNGSFGQGSSHVSDISPENWWRIYGKEDPELQQLAIRILSQTCNGASKYNLKRRLAEKLLTEGRNPIEQRRLTDLVFVHYNLHLQNFNETVETGIPSDEINPLDDWVVDKTHPIPSEVGALSWMDLACKKGTANLERRGDLGCSSSQHKLEQ